MDFGFRCCTEYENENESRRRLDFARSLMERDQTKEDLNICVIRNGNRVCVGKKVTFTKVVEVGDQEGRSERGAKGRAGLGEGHVKFTVAALDSVQVYRAVLRYFSAV